jgi:hypothetical protein
MTQYVGLDVSLKETKLHDRPSLSRASATPNPIARFISTGLETNAHRSQSVPTHCCSGSVSMRVIPRRRST